MTEQIWHTLIVRAWHDRDGFKVRFIVQTGQLPPSTAVEGSVEAACRRFDAWLRSAEAGPPATPAAAPHRRRRRRTRRRPTHRGDEPETGEQTAAP
ncbi:MULTISPECIES: hypothetical protein [Kribbella]|uniref:hypothetical protein n=1 Tax=Kribbella TaxID=182639 RepID=UPI001305218D|nr:MULTISPECIES: hypothetical protein [Kribbella]